MVRENGWENKPRNGRIKRRKTKKWHLGMMKLTNAEQVSGTDVHLVLQIVHQADSK